LYARPSSLIRFAQFTLELATGELKKNGLSVKLAPQPSRVLVLLVQRAGQIVTREEIRDHIWSNETFVDFDKGLNFCIKQIRAALRDDAEHPTYVETLPRRGYRFIAPVEGVVDADTARRPVLREGQSSDSGVPVNTEAASWFRNRRAWVLLATTASLAFFVYASFYRARTVTFPNRGWIVIAAFENRTGEPIFNGTVESALQRELSESRFVSVLPQERIQDALWLMRKDKHTVLEPDVAREVALRDGNTALVLTGRVERLGHTYLLSASLVDPGNGMLRRSLSEEAADQDRLLSAVRRLARDVRDAVGETETAGITGSEELEKATTPSLRALQFYSKGIAFINHVDPEDWTAGQEMFNRAVQEDPEFASAHVYLAHCYSNAGKNKEARAHFEKAFELADKTTDRERYFILGSYYSFKGDSARAIDAYQVLLQLYPDDFWGVNNLAFELTAAKRPDDALPYIIRRAELRPNDLDSNYVAWDVLSEKGIDPERAQIFLERARALATTKEASKRPGAWTRLQFVVADQYLHQGDMVRGLQELDRVAARLEDALGDSRALFLDELGNRYFYLGRLHDAERYYRQLSGGTLHMELGALAEVRGDEQTFRKELLAQFASGEELGPGTASRLAREGFISEAEKVLAAPLMGEIQPVSRVQAARGELMFARGHRQEGLREMQAAWQSLRPFRNDNAIMVAQYLSDALIKSGNTGEAIEVLEQELADKPDPAALYWTTGCELRLVQLYKTVGRDQDARTMELRIREQLSVADADHPMLAALRTLDTMAALR
jgi:DNA-binding winged helix-turn-helix (wHTH) protein/tetratricopeptide (TPR) repeat protein